MRVRRANGTGNGKQCAIDVDIDLDLGVEGEEEELMTKNRNKNSKGSNKVVPQLVTITPSAAGGRRRRRARLDSKRHVQGVSFPSPPLFFVFPLRLCHVECQADFLRVGNCGVQHNRIHPGTTKILLPPPIPSPMLTPPQCLRSDRAPQKPMRRSV